MSRRLPVAYRPASSLKCGEDGWPLSPPAVTARARTRSPNSTTATKLFPLVPYHFLVPGYARAPKDASDPQAEEVKATGMLGPASLNGWTMSPVRRWNRLMSPQGVFQLPKSACSLSDATASDSRRSSGRALPMSSKPILLEPSWRLSSVPQNTASDVATDVALHRRSHLRSNTICSA